MTPAVPEQSITFLELDVDGTLANSLPMVCRTYRQAAREIAGVNLEAALVEQLFLGSNDGTIRAALQEVRGEDFPTSGVRARHRELQDLEVATTPEPKMPGVDELLALAEERGTALGANSGNIVSRTQARLERIGILNRLHAVVGGDEVPPDKGKPEPDSFHLLMQRLLATSVLPPDTIPSQGVVIGDSEVDIIGGQRAGRYTLYIPSNGTVQRAAAERATWVRPSLNDAVPLLRRLLRPRNDD